MYIRFKLKDGSENNIVASNIESFKPNGDGALITMINGNTHKVDDTVRAIRTAFRKLHYSASPKETQEAAE